MFNQIRCHQDLSQSHRDNSLKKLRSLPVACGGIDDVDDDCRQVGRHEDGGRVPAENDLNLEACPRLVQSWKSENPGSQFLDLWGETWEKPRTDNGKKIVN